MWPTTRDNPTPTRTGFQMGSSISKCAAVACCGALIVLLAACGDSDDGGGTAPGPRGDFWVVTATSGVEFDVDGYEIRVNDLFAAIVGPNDSVSFDDRSVDSYLVQLTEVATNCLVAGDNPRPVQVIADSAVGTTFEVSCSATSGILRVVTSTGGPNPADGYALAIDDLDAGIIGANDTVTAADLETGEHTVRLGDIALNCRLIGDAERSVLVPSNGTRETTYELRCTDQVGYVRLVTATTGPFPDADGYEVVIEFGSPISVGATAVRTVGSVAAGVTRVRLLESSVAAHCAVQGENPQTITVPAGGLVSTVFDVACGVP